VTVTADTNAHTYGAWTEVIASLPSITSMLEIFVGGVSQSGVATGSVLSVGVGASGSEAEIFHYAVGSAFTTNAPFSLGVNILIPVRLDAGTRIAVRLQSVITLGKTALVAIRTFNAEPESFVNLPLKHDSLGVNLATSRGTNIGASNVYSEIVASTSNTYRGLCLIPSASAGMSADQSSMTVAVGPSGSEVDIGTIIYITGAAETVTSPLAVFMPRFIPSGSRISVKQSSVRTYMDATVIGVHI
jgi:hypothetical protein